MKTIHLLLVITTIFTQFVYSQQDDKNTCDKIIFIDGTELEVIVKEVKPSEIKYKKCEFQDGPSYSVESSKVFIIKYKDGRKQIINTAESAKVKRIASRKLFINFIGEFTYSNYMSDKLSSFSGLLGLNYRINKYLEADLGYGFNITNSTHSQQYSYDPIKNSQIHEGSGIGGDFINTNFGVRYNFIKLNERKSLYIKPNLQVLSKYLDYRKIYPSYDVFIGTRFLNFLDFSIGYSYKYNRNYTYKYIRNYTYPYDSNEDTFSETSIPTNTFTTRLIFHL